MEKFDPEKLKKVIERTKGLTPKDISRIVQLDKENKQKVEALELEKARLKIIQESIPLFEENVLLQNEAEALVAKIGNNTVRSSFVQERDDLRNISQELQRAPTKELLDLLQTKIKIFKISLDTVKSFVAQNEKVPDVLSTWPSNIYFRDNNKAGTGKGWFFKGPNGEEALHGEWDAAKTNIEPVFLSYKSFMQDGAAKDRTEKIATFGDLIQAKNHVIKALQEKNPGDAQALAVTLSALIEEKKLAWNILAEEKKKATSIEKQKEEVKKVLIEKKKEIAEQQKKLALVLTWKPSDDEKDFFEQSIKEIQNSVLAIEKKLDEVGAFDNSLLENLTKKIEAFSTRLEKVKGRFDKINTFGGRVIRTQIIGGDNARLIKPVGTHMMTVGERLMELSHEETKKNDGGRVKKAQDTAALVEKHRNMYGRNPLAYIQLYTTRREVLQPEGKIKVFYYFKDFVRGDPNQEIVKFILIQNETAVEEDLKKAPENQGKIVAFMSTEGNSAKQERQEKEERRKREIHPLSIHAYKQTYSPMFDRNKKGNFPDKTAKEADPKPILVKESNYTGGMSSPGNIAAKFDKKPQAIETVQEAPPSTKMKERVSKVLEKLTTIKSFNSKPAWVKGVILATPLVIGSAYFALHTANKQAVEPIQATSQESNDWEKYLSPEQGSHVADFKKMDSDAFIKKMLGTEDETLLNKVKNYTGKEIKEILLSPQTILTSDSKGGNYQLAISNLISFIQNTSQAKDAPGLASSIGNPAIYKPVELRGLGESGETFAEFIAKVRTKIS